MAQDARSAVREAERALTAKRPSEALGPLWSALDRTHVEDAEVSALLPLLARALEGVGKRRAAGTVYLFLGDVGRARALSDEHPTDLARCALARGNRSEAAQCFETAGFLAHAAIEREHLGEHARARALWERLSEDPRLASDLYVRGLVRYCLAVACRASGDDASFERVRVESMHLLEGAADGFELRGLRERAFDCFQILIAMGRDGAFENLAEGYLNCIRILDEDNLRHYVLQYFEDFQKLALERGEHHAAATLFREAAQFCRRHRLPYDSHYATRAAETQRDAARQILERGGPPTMAENAYAAAIDGFNDLGRYAEVRAIYARLAELPLADKRRSRYLRLERRLEGIADESLATTPFPDYLRVSTAYPEVWRLDTVEWEQAGDVAETMGEVMLDARWPSYTRRRALLCRLHQLADPAGPVPERLVARAELLGRVEVYASLAPLERLVGHEDPKVRAACLRAAHQLFFKRTFELVRRGLDDADAGVRKEARSAIGTLHFEHALDPLRRIFLGSADAEVRRTALGAIGKVPTLGAAEILVDTLREGEGPERELAAELLARATPAEVTSLLERERVDAEGDHARVLEQILSRRRGGRR